MTTRTALALAAMLAVAGLARADDHEPTTQPATAPATQPDADALRAEMEAQMQAGVALRERLEDVSRRLEAAMGGPEAILDDERRVETAGEVVPLLRELRQGMIEAQEAGLLPPGVDRQAEMMLVLYGDEATAASIEEAAAGDGEDAVAATSVLIGARYLDAETPEAADAVIDDLQAAAEANPTSDPLAQMTLSMVQMPASGDPQIDRLLAILGETFTIPQANEMAAMMTQQRDMMRAMQEQAESEVEPAATQPATQPVE